MSLASEKIGFIYIRVPRTGSATFLHHLTAALGPALVDVGSKHASARELRALWSDEWERFFSFGFVRNPWDWLVSVYNAGVSVTAGPPELWAGAPIEPSDAPGIHPGERDNAPFDVWVRQRKTTPMDWLSDGDEILVDEIWRFEDMIERTQVAKGGIAHRPYREWYTPALSEYVAERCRREIEIGGYVF